MVVLTRAAPLLMVLLLGSCYSPKIQDGGLVCAAADGGPRCPDGFQCNASDNHCYRSGGPCTKAAPICQDAPSPGAACSPACQIGCDCGRCNVSGVAAVCSPFIGAKALGEVCSPERDDCGAGLICLLEMCGSRLARCYQHCNGAAQCKVGVACETPILTSAGASTGFLTCDLAPQDCDPIANPVSKSGCPDAALNCYVGEGGATLCDCPGRTLRQDDHCDAFNDCAPGLMCASGSAVAGRACRPICLTASPACPAGQHCIGSGGKLGYCGG